MNIRRIAMLAAMGVFMAACAPAPPAPDSQSGMPAVERTRVPDTPTPPKVPSDVPGAPALPAPPAIDFPPNALYVCVVDHGGTRKQTVIEYAPKVGALCAKAPEMGPCQYERNACRHTGGRVYAANGDEITMATEAEYDKKVMRVHFRSN